MTENHKIERLGPGPAPEQQGQTTCRQVPETLSTKLQS